MTPEQQLAAWRKLGDSVRIENERLQVLATKMGLANPFDRQGYEGPHTAFSIIEALRTKLRDVAISGVESDDPRLDYVVVQIDRDTWNELQQFKERT